MKFGDIYTNGINYWMVTLVPEPPIPCNNPNHIGFYSTRHELRPVVLDKMGNPEYFVGRYDGQIEDIKPSAKLIGRLVFVPLTPPT